MLSFLCCQICGLLNEKDHKLYFFSDNHENSGMIPEVMPSILPAIIQLIRKFLIIVATPPTLVYGFSSQCGNAENLSNYDPAC